MTTTISAAQGASTAAPSTETEIALPRALATQLKAEFGNRSLERLEQECRELIQTTAQAALELGKRLLMLKEIAGHGNWLLTLQRIGIHNKSAQNLMRAAVRILSLPDHARLIEAAKNKSKLLELLVLDDEELQRLNLGDSVRGVSLGNLPMNSVATLRSMLRESAPAVEPVIVDRQSSKAKATAPVTPPNAAAVVGMATSVPLLGGDLVKSLHAGRTGKVVKVYPDGSACVCWDDGEPQAEGLGHERMPRQLLVLIECAEQVTAAPADEATETPAAPEAIAEATAPAENPRDFPAALSTVRGEFSGREVMLIIHKGKTWMIAEEVAAVLGQTPDEVSEIEQIIAADFANNEFPEYFAKVRIASMFPVSMLLDHQAIRQLALERGIQNDTALAAAALANWIDEISRPANVDMPSAASSAEQPAHSGVYLNERFEQLDYLHGVIWDVLHRISNHTKALWVVLSDNSKTAESIDMGTMIDIATSIVEPYNELLDDMEGVISDIKRRIFREPEPGALMPESVWLDLVTELATERAAFSSEDALRVADLATNLRSFAHSSPEVAGAQQFLAAFAERHGAQLYEHEKSNMMVFSWLPGHAPAARPRASATH